MDLNLRLAMLILAGLIIVAVVFDAIRSKLKERSGEKKRKPSPSQSPLVTQSKSNQPQTNKVEKPANNILMISVHAQSGCFFGDYDFVQTLGAVGLSFGEHSIFHYHRVNEKGSECLFSVASLTNPGTFNLDKMNEMQCKGLLLFMDLSQVSDCSYALDAMLEVAYQLAEELDGNLFEGYNTPWNEESEEHLVAQIKAVRQGGTLEKSETRV